MSFPKIRVFDGALDVNINADRFTAQYSRAQKWLDNQVITDSNPYVPFQSGDLRRSAIRGTVPGEGEIVWDSPYARYQYYGKVMIGPPPKELTDMPLQYHTPGTGSFWFENAKSVKKQQWINGARKIAGGG